MKENVLTEQDEPIFSLLHSFENIHKGLSSLLGNCRPPLNGERYLTDRDVSALLRVSRRTLQEYRHSGNLPFFRLGGKILYRESDLQKMLGERCHSLSDNSDISSLK